MSHTETLHASVRKRDRNRIKKASQSRFRSAPPQLPQLGRADARESFREAHAAGHAIDFRSMRQPWRSHDHFWLDRTVVNVKVLLEERCHLLRASIFVRSMTLKGSRKA